MIRFVHLQLKRLATALAVVATLAFALDGALGADHHLPVSGGGVHHHAHAHNHTGAAHQQVVDGDVTGSADITAAHQDLAPQSGPDANVICCFCACTAAVVLPSQTAQVVPFVLPRTTITAGHRTRDGIVPEGLRRPPRPLAIT